MKRFWSFATLATLCVFAMMIVQVVMDNERISLAIWTVLLFILGAIIFYL